MAKCDTTYTEHVRVRHVRLTDNEPMHDEWDDRYFCERETGHGGDHHGPITNLRPDRASTFMTWPVQPLRMSAEDADRFATASTDAMQSGRGSVKRTMDILWEALRGVKGDAR